jgi:hypothetical protein
MLQFRDVLIRQQHEIEGLTVPHRELKNRATILEAGGGASAQGFERLPHYYCRLLPLSGMSSARFDRGSRSAQS